VCASWTPIAADTSGIHIVSGMECRDQCSFFANTSYCREVTRFGCASECGIIINEADVPVATEYVRETDGVSGAGALSFGVALVLAAGIVALY
jgi:hypothetical protein